MTIQSGPGGGVPFHVPTNPATAPAPTGTPASATKAAETPKTTAPPADPLAAQVKNAGVNMHANVQATEIAEELALRSDVKKIDDAFDPENPVSLDYDHPIHTRISKFNESQIAKLGINSELAKLDVRAKSGDWIDKMSIAVKHEDEDGAVSHRFLTFDIPKPEDQAAIANIINQVKQVKKLD